MPDPPKTAAEGMRARDLDRVRARSLLDAAYEEGQLGADEYHSRSDRAATATTIAELRELVSDLQTPEGAARWSEPRQPNPAARRVGRYPDHIRARAEDRALTCRALDTALADGQLSEQEHRTLTELTAQAETLGDLAGLTEDLQKPTEAPIDPRTRVRPRAARLAGAVAVVAVIAAVGGFRLTHTSAPPPAAAAPMGQAVAAEVIETPDLTTGAGFEHFRRLYQAKFGDTVVDELRLYPGDASIERTTMAQPNRVVDYSYRGGFMATSAMTTREAGKPIFDLATVNASVLGDLLGRAVSLLKVESGAVSHIMMDVDTITKAPAIAVYVSNEFNESGHLEVTPAGELIDMYAFGD